MTSKDGDKFGGGRVPRHIGALPCISHVETVFFKQARELVQSDPEHAKAEARRILRDVPSWYGQLEQLIRSAHECGTASSAQGARERFNAINAERLEVFLAQKGERIETLLWNGVYAHLLVQDFGPNYLSALFEGIRAFELLIAVETLEGRSRPPSWHSYCELPISHPRTLGAIPPIHVEKTEVPAQKTRQERETVHPTSEIRELASDDLFVIEKTLKAIESKVK